ncbi:MAG: M14 family zinc carboxypeptidase [Planctomycetota bacterium]
MSSRFLLALLVTIVTVAAADAQRIRYDGYKLVRTHPETNEELMYLDELATHLMSESHGHGPVDFLFSPAALIQLEDENIPFIVLDNDIQAAIDAETARVAASQRNVSRMTWYDDYKTNDQIFDYMNDLVTNNPTLIAREVIGTSVDGQPIYGYTISGAGDAATKPALCFNGTIHAREWVSPMTLTYIADQLVTGYGSNAQITDLLDNVTFYVVNVLNPDGYEYSWDSVRLWRKNRTLNSGGSYGVDLNRNWGLGWGGPGSSGSQTSDTYRGTAAFSEPETVAMRDYIVNRTNIVAHIDFHSFSQLVLWPFGHDHIDPPAEDLAVFQDLGHQMADDIHSVHGSVYTPQASRDLYIASGTSSDWIYDATGVFSWTVELRPASEFQGGFTLPANQILPTVEENFAAVLGLAESVAAGVDLQFLNGAPDVIDVLSPAPLDVRITPIVSGPLNTATATMHWRVGDSGPFTPTSLTHTGDNDYTGAFPAAPCGESIQYYFTIDATTGGTYTVPRIAPVTMYEVEVTEITVAFGDDFESDTGWTVQNAPGLTDGAWNRGTPVGGGDRGDPASDADGSGACYLTDNVDGNSDVDGGATTLTSPSMDASDPDATLVYSRWYSNDFGGAPLSDVFVVEVSDDDGSSWVNLETVGPGGNEVGGGWIAKEFRVADIPGITNTPTLRVRFTAEDAGDGSVIEAGVDGVQVRSTGCTAVPVPCPGDVDGVNGTNLNDFTILASNFGATGLPHGSGESRTLGDLDDNGDVNLADFTALAADFGCTP